MKSVILFVMALFFMSFCALAADDVPFAPSHTPYEYGLSPYLALSSGAELYLGCVSAKRVDEKKSNINVESGQVDFSVDEVIRGRTLKTIVLSYQNQIRVGGRRPTPTPWPLIDDLMKKNATLLVVVAPFTQDNEKSKISDATNVYVVEGKDDPNLLTYRQFLETFSKKGEELEKTLLAFAQSKESLRRHFAQEFAYVQLEGDAALKIIQAQLETAAGQKGISRDYSAGLTHLFHLAYDAGRNAQLREKAQKTLALHAASENVDVSGAAIQCLASIIEKEIKPAKEMLTPAELEKLRNAALTATGDPTNIMTRETAQKVLQWIEKSK